MSDQNASSGEMRWLPDELDESLLDLLLNGQPLPTDAPEQVRVVAEMLVTLVAPAGPGELAGEAAALSAFARGGRQAATSHASRRLARRVRPSWLPVHLRTKLTAGLVAIAIGAGGAAAAYAGVLPDPIQDLAHFLLHAPSPHPATRQKHDHPAGHKPGVSTRPTRRGPTTGRANANQHPKPNRHRKPNPHRRANPHRKPNPHRKANPHAKPNPHAKANPSPQGQHGIV